MEVWSWQPDPHSRPLHSPVDCDRGALDFNPRAPQSPCPAITCSTLGLIENITDFILSIYTNLSAEFAVMPSWQHLYTDPGQETELVCPSPTRATIPTSYSVKLRRKKRPYQTARYPYGEPLRSHVTIPVNPSPVQQNMSIAARYPLLGEGSSLVHIESFVPSSDSCPLPPSTPISSSSSSSSTTSLSSTSTSSSPSASSA